MTILVTGAAGFIGFHICKKLLNDDFNVVGIDNLNDYYDPDLKKARIKNINAFASANSLSWHFKKISLENQKQLDNIFSKFKPKIVVNLAAQAGVRYSLKNTKSYINSNLVGFSNLLESVRIFNVENFIYASSSSVYGGNKKFPFSESDNVDHPVSLYAATKKSNEILSHSYSHLYKIPCTGLRFFTVYGPWGRPDMAPMIFAKAILNEDPIDIFNYGNMQRDFTYIDDISEALVRCCFKQAYPDPNFKNDNPEPDNSWAPYRIFNIGHGSPINLMSFIEILEDALGKKAIKNFKPIEPGDVIKTSSENTKLNSWINYKPNTSLEVGIIRFAEWYKSYYL